MQNYPSAKNISGFKMAVIIGIVFVLIAVVIAVYAIALAFKFLKNAGVE